MPFRGNVPNSLPLFPYKSRESSGWKRCETVKRAKTFSTLNLKLFFAAGETAGFFFFLVLPPGRGETGLIPGAVPSLEQGFAC